MMQVPSILNFLIIVDISTSTSASAKTCFIKVAIIIMKPKPTIYRLVNQGILPSYKKGKKLYFYKDELLAWIENGRKATKEQNHSEMLKAMQGGMKRKPKSMYNF